MPRGRIKAEIKFPIGILVHVYKKSTGTLAEIGDEGTVETAPYAWYVTPGSGPRLCVVIKNNDLCKQVRTKDLRIVKVDEKGGLPA